MKQFFVIIFFLIVGIVPCIGQNNMFTITSFFGNISKVSIKKTNNKTDTIGVGDQFSKNDIVYLKKGQGINYTEDGFSSERITYDMMRIAKSIRHEPKWLYMSIADYKNKKDNHFSHRGSKITHGDDDSLFKFVGDEEVVRPLDGTRRVAVVIGNFNYQDTLWKHLPTCEYTTLEVAKTLRRIGFRTIVLENAKRNSIYDAARQLKACTKDDSTTIKLFYYTGHGKRSKGDTAHDYIIPADATMHNYNDYIRVDGIVNEMYRDKNNNKQYQLLYIDACRDIDTAFVNQLSKWNPDQGTIIVSSVSEGKKSFANINDNDVLTPFAQSFIHYINKPNISLSKINAEIKKEVGTNTSRGDSRLTQIPAINSHNDDSWDIILNCCNSRSYWGLEASLSSPLSLSGGVGAHWGFYLCKEGFWKNVFSEVGISFNTLKSDKLYLYKTSKALDLSESFKYNYRLDLYGRIGYDDSKYWLVPYFELAEQNYFSKHSASALALSGNVRIKLPFWNAYIAGGGGFATSLGDNLGLVWHKAPLKNILWNVQVGINFHK